jgi:hypothetical protein
MRISDVTTYVLGAAWRHLTFVEHTRRTVGGPVQL